MTSSPGEGYGQLEIDPEIKGWTPIATLIAMYYCASGFTWKTVALLITVKTKNGSLREYHVQDAMEKFLYQYKKYYNRDDDVFDLYQVGTKIAAFMRSNSIARDERIPLWESLMTIKHREWETMMGVSLNQTFNSLSVTDIMLKGG